MEKTLTFNSQITTSRSQSHRLLALGLKKETADMALHFSCMDMDGNAYYIPYAIGHQCTGIPAWSLHRLIEMMGASNIQHWLGLNVERDFDLIIDTIEELIKEGYFNKEYLV